MNGITTRLGVLCLALTLGGVIDAFGFKPPARPPLPNLDNRPVESVSPVAGSARAAATADVQKRHPDVRVKQDALGRPRLVQAQAGFLTGPKGEGGNLSAASLAAFPASDPDRVLKAFLKENKALFGHGPEALEAARKTRESVGPKNGLRSVTWQQQVDGIPVFEAVLTAHTTKQGELVNVSGQFLPDLEVSAESGTPNRAAALAGPAVTAEQAVRAAAAAIGVAVKGGDVAALGAPIRAAEREQRFTAPGLSGETRASLAWLPMNRTSFRLCWDVILTGRERGEMFRILVDAQTGEVWLRRCLTVYATDASYRVFTSDSPSPFSPGLSSPGSYQPPVVSRDLVTWSALSTNASPNGWIDDGGNTTLGNNVDAHLDLNDDDVADPGSRPTGSPARVFDFTMDLNQAPSTYRPAAVVQLFYLNNYIHDRLYDLGFTEAAGNFQTSNYGRGGVGGDAVQADAQDGSGTDNANMSTPPDGMAPRMQMYVFTGPSPDRDGDFDAEIVLHEYTHGLSNRRVGNGVGISALQSAGMGEGWSDFYPLALLSESGDDPHACYATGGYATYQFYGLTQNYYYGIRRYPYSTDMTKNPLTFKDIDPAQASAHSGVPTSPIFGGGAADEVHNMGEVWCVMLWEARARLVDKYGWATGNTLMLQLVTDAMGLCPANPNFVESRDAIIQADAVLTGGANYRDLWTAFAKRGLGVSATSPDSDSTAGLKETYDMPDDLQVSPARGWTCSGYLGGPFSPTSTVYTLTNMGGNPLSWKAIPGAGWVSLSLTNGVLTAGGSNTVRVSLTSAIESMAVGEYTASLIFSNLTSKSRQTMTITLVVMEIPGKIGIIDSVLPSADTNVPFGDVTLGYSRREQIVVTNTDLTHDLVVSGIGFGYYQEDFNDGLAQGWAPDSAAYWSVSNNEYVAQLKTGTRFMQSVYSGEKWVDCNARVTMQRTGYAYNSAVLVLRASDNFSGQSSKGSAYMIGITPVGYYYVGKYVNGTFSFLQSWSLSPYLNSSDNVVECNIRGNEIEVYFNGHLAISGTDNSIPNAGRVGVMGYSETTSKTVHYFDDVTVGQWVSGGSVSAAQQWYNAHPCPHGDPTAMPADWTAPAFTGTEPAPAPVPAGLSSKISGPFQLGNLPDMPLRLAPGAGFSLEVAFSPVTTDPAQNHVVILSNDKETPELRIPVSGRGRVNPLDVSPASWIAVRGREGGPFSPSGTVYTVTNTGGSVLTWMASNPSPWLTVAPLSGTLAAGRSASVTVTVVSGVAWLPEGLYSNPVTFYNPSVWGPRIRGVLLLIGRFPKLDLSPLSFGITNTVGSKSLRNLKVANPGDSNLVWNLRLPNDNLTENFEKGQGSWTHYGANDNWHLSTNRAFSGTNAWYSGVDATRQYVNYMNGYLISPPLKLLAGATLSFRNWYVTEPNFDYGNVGISINNGLTYTTLATFTGSNTSWSVSSFDLSAYAGKTALFQFRFHSDSMNSAYEGWYVDDVQIAPVDVPAGNIVTADAIGGLVPPGGATNVALIFDSVGMLNGAIKAGELTLACNDPHAPANTLPFSLRVVPPLSMTIPAQAAEGDGLLAGAGLLTLPEALAADLRVNLVSSDPEEISVPDRITIPAGETNAVFDLTVLDDRKVDGAQPITISALSDYYGSRTITVADNETTNVTLVLPARGYEGESFATGGRVMLSGTWPSDLTVSLQSSDTSEAVVPDQVAIPAGATSAFFAVSLPLDGLSDRSQTSLVSAVIAGFAPASARIETQDRDIHHFAIGAVASPQKTGTPFLFSVTAKNIQGETVTAYRETVTLSAAGSGGTLPLEPSNAPFVNGVWAGLARVNKPGLNVRITVGAGLPYTAKSNPFEVKAGALDHIAWRSFVSPQNVNYSFPVTLTAQDAANNTVTGFTGTVFLSGLTGGGVSTTLLDEAGFVPTNTGFRTAGFRFTPDRTLVVTHLRRFWGSRVSLWTDAGGLLATRTFSGAAGAWTESELDTPVQLLAGTTYRLAAYAPALPSYVREDEAPAAFPDGAVVGGCYTDAGEVFPDVLCGPRFLADLRYTPGVSQPVIISPVKSGKFVKGVWSGSVTVMQKATNLCLKAADAAGHAGISRLFDVGSLSLFLQMPSLVWENDGTRVNSGTVTLSRAVSTNVVVGLASGDTTELTVAARVTVPAGKTSVPFSLVVVDDAIDDGPQAVQVTATLAGYVPGVKTIEVRPTVVRTPVMTPAGCLFDGSRAVTLACATAGALIRHTLDGSEVTETSDLVVNPVMLTESCTLKAKAFKATCVPSETAEGVFTKTPATVAENNATVFNLAGDAGARQYFKIELPVLATNLQFSISGGTGDCDLIVRYAEMPTTTAYDYYPAQTGNTESVTVVAPAAGVWYALLLAGPEGFDGVRLSVSYAIQLPPVIAPVVTPAGGTLVGSILVSMTSATANATIRYTLDGSVPGSNSTAYAGPVRIDPAPVKTVKAKATKAGRDDSDVVSVTYKIATPLTAGSPLVISGKKNGISYFAIQVPSGTKQLRCLLTAGSGNGNLYVRKGKLPTLTAYDTCSLMANNNELIVIANPQANKWYYFMVYGKTAYTQAILQASKQ